MHLEHYGCSCFFVVFPGPWFTIKCIDNRIQPTGLCYWLFHMDFEITQCVLCTSNSWTLCGHDIEDGMISSYSYFIAALPLFLKNIYIFIYTYIYIYIYIIYIYYICINKYINIHTYHTYFIDTLLDRIKMVYRQYCRFIY